MKNEDDYDVNFNISESCFTCFDSYLDQRFPVYKLNQTMYYDVNNRSILERRYKAYLDEVCKCNFTKECSNLLHYMVNISVRLNLSEYETSLLGNRVIYLSQLQFPKPYLFIHLPKCAGHTMGDILSKHHGFKTYWDPLIDISYDQLKAKGFPNTIGHLGYGFDFLFLNDKQKEYHLTYYQRRQLIGGPKPKEKIKYNELNKEYEFDKINLNNVEPNVWFNGLNYSYMTILRDPISRTFSHYSYHKRLRDDENHRFAKRHNFSEWIKYHEVGNNQMTGIYIYLYIFLFYIVYKFYI